MSAELYVKILHRLVSKTTAGQQEWSEGPLEQSFYTQVAGNGISLRKVNEDYVLLIHNEEGSVVDSISDPALKSRGLNNAYGIMGNLYEMAQRNAFGADKVLRQIAEELDK